VKISVSLPTQDIQFLDAYIATHRVESRSAALHRAVRLLKATELSNAYENAWDEWASSGEAETWEPSVADGLGNDAAR